MKKLLFILCLLPLLSQTVVQGQSVGSNVIVWDFVTRDGEKNSLTDNFTRAFEAALVQQGSLTIIERSPDLKSLIDREREVRDIFGISDAALSNLKVKGAEMVIFGDVYDDIESNEVNVTVTFQSFDGQKVLIKSKLIPRDKIKDSLRRQKAMEELVENISIRIAPTGASRSGELMRVQSNDFIFDLEECSLVDRKVTCRLLITNNGEDRELAIYLNDRYGNISSLFDEYNNEVQASRIQLANKSRDGEFSVKATLISGRPAETTMIFDGVSSRATTLIRFDIRCWEGENETNFTARFRNVPLKR